MRNTRKQLKHMESIRGLLTPDSFWVKRNRDTMMARMHESAHARQPQPVHARQNAVINTFLHTFVPQRILFAARPVMTFFFVLLVAIAGWSASVSATFNCLPGDICWSVKVVHEKTQIAFATVGVPKEDKKGIKIKRNLEFADRRVEEIKHLVKHKDGDTSRRVSAAKKELEKSVNTAVSITNQEVKENIKDEKVVEAVALAKDTQKETEEIAKELKNLKEETKKPEDRDLAKEVSEAAKQVDGTLLKQVEAIVESADLETILTTDEGLKDEVRSLVSNALNTVLEDNETVKMEAEGVGVIKSGPEDIATSGGTNGTQGTAGSVGGSNTSTASVADGIASASSTMAAQAVEALFASSTGGSAAGRASGEQDQTPSSKDIDRVKENAEQVRNSAQEVRQLIEDGKLREALDKIKNFDQITNSGETTLGKVETGTVLQDKAPAGAANTGQTTELKNGG